MSDEGAMRSNEAGGAVEQLYDELLARTWALRSIAEAVCADPTSEPVADALLRAAAQQVERVHDRTTGATELAHVLWPCGPPPPAGDPWWQTPLGRLLAARRAPPGPAAAPGPRSPWRSRPARS